MKNVIEDLKKKRDAISGVITGEERLLVRTKENLDRNSAALAELDAAITLLSKGATVGQ